MSKLLWLPSSRATNPLTIFSTELNSLANNAGVLSTAAIENGTSLDLYADFALTVQFGTAPSAFMPVELYIVASVDGSAFDDTNGGGPTNGWGDVFPVRADTTQRTYTIRGIELPPRDFKVYLKNGAGQAFAASGNVLKAYFYTRSVQ